MFRAISYYYDGTRDTTQNRHLTSLSTKSLDVQGFSHKKGEDFDKFHRENPGKPLLATVRAVRRCWDSPLPALLPAPLTPAAAPAGSLRSAAAA